MRFTSPFSGHSRELARRRRGIREEEDNDEEAEREQEQDQDQEDIENQENEPALTSIEEQAVQAVKAIADGGEVLQSDGGRDVQDQRLLANEIACEMVGIDHVQDFAPFCVVVEDV